MHGHNKEIRAVSHDIMGLEDARTELQDRQALARENDPDVVLTAEQVEGNSITLVLIYLRLIRVHEIGRGSAHSNDAATS